MRLIILFILIFGPKIGWFDTRIILLILPLIISNWTFDKGLIGLFIFYLTGILAIDVLINNELSTQEYLRYFRVLTGIIIIPGSIKFFRVKKTHLITILSIHLFIVLVTLFFPFLKNSVDVIVGFEKSLKPFRRNGLTMGYDMAGFLLFVLIILTTNDRRQRVVNSLSYIGVFFTSRVSIVLSYMFYIFRKMVQNIYVFLAVVFITVFVYWNKIMDYYDLILILLGIKTTNLDTFGGYAVYSLSSLQEQIFVWPKTLKELIFGYSAKTVDSGWSMLIQNAGILGLSMVFGLYKYMYKFSGKNKIFLLIVFTAFLLNTKNSYLLSRNSFETLLILASIQRYDNFSA